MIEEEVILTASLNSDVKLPVSIPGVNNTLVVDCWE
jgi:hypothetical protein